MSSRNIDIVTGESFGHAVFTAAPEPLACVHPCSLDGRRGRVRDRGVPLAPDASVDFFIRTCSEKICEQDSFRGCMFYFGPCCNTHHVRRPLSSHTSL